MSVEAYGTGEDLIKLEQVVQQASTNLGAWTKLMEETGSPWLVERVNYSAPGLSLGSPTMTTP